MTRPMVHELDDENKAWRELGQLRERVRRLERRPQGAAAGAAAYPIGNFPVVEPAALMYGIDGTGWTRSAVTADEWGSWKWQATADTKYFVRGFRLGPYGSSWSINYAIETGPDCGKLQFAWATGREDSPDDNTYGPYEINDGLLESPWSKDHTSLTGEYAQNVIIATSDLYSSTAGIQTIEGATQALDFRILGADGDVLTAFSDPFTDPDPDTQRAQADGGAGIWWLTCRCTGKNASSSGYRVTIRQMSVNRLTADGYPA